MGSWSISPIKKQPVLGSLAGGETSGIQSNNGTWNNVAPIVFYLIVQE
jgi:hypothetical protein